VARIFLAKRTTPPHGRSLSARLAAEYHVTTKTVRDIWNGRNGQAFRDCCDCQSAAIVPPAFLTDNDLHWYTVL
jgi:hypothetical protein